MRSLVEELCYIIGGMGFGKDPLANAALSPPLCPIDPFILQVRKLRLKVLKWPFQCSTDYRLVGVVYYYTEVQGPTFLPVLFCAGHIVMS